MTEQGVAEPNSGPSRRDEQKSHDREPTETRAAELGGVVSLDRERRRR